MKKKSTPLADDLLKAASALPPQETDEFFYTRLKARMENAHEDKRSWNLSLKPSFLAGILAILLLMNGVFFFSRQKTSTVSSGTELQTFATSYDLTLTTPY